MDTATALFFEACNAGDVATLRNALSGAHKDTLVAAKDGSGHTGLHHAVRGRHVEAVRLLLAAGSEIKSKSADGWNALHEAIVTGHDEIVRMVYIAYQDSLWARYQKRLPLVCENLLSHEDFYLELRWEFTSSIIPFMSRFAPSDTYRVWKHGDKLRIDSTLVGMNGVRVQRGNVEFLFTGSDGRILQIDHDEKEIRDVLEGLHSPNEKALDQGIKEMSGSTAMQSDLNTHDMEMAPQSGWLTSHKSERVGEFDAKLYDAKNIRFTMVRRPGAKNKKGKKKKKKAEEEEEEDGEGASEEDGVVIEHTEDYQVLSKKVSATLWLTDQFPVAIDELLPLFEVLAPTGRHFENFRRVLDARLPDGMFPVKVKVPVVPAIAAQVTFGVFRHEGVDADLFTVPDYAWRSIEDDLDEMEREEQLEHEPLELVASDEDEGELDEEEREFREALKEVNGEEGSEFSSMLGRHPPEHAHAGAVEGEGDEDDDDDDDDAFVDATHEQEWASDDDEDAFKDAQS